MGKYLDIARQFEARMQAEGQESSPLSSQSSPLWSCEHCGNPVEIEAVEPSLDGQRLLTFWNCQRCQVWAVTPSTLRQPPVWVSSKEQ